MTHRVFHYLKFYIIMRLFSNFGNCEAYGEDVRLWAFFNGHLLIFRAHHRFRWIIELC